MAVGHQVHHVFFQVGTGTADDIDFTLADHFGQGDAQFRRTHRAGQGHHHFAPFQKMRFIPFSRIYQRSCVKMSVMMFDELGNRTFVHFLRRLSRKNIDFLGLAATQIKKPPRRAAPRKAQPCKIIKRKKAALIFRPKGGLPAVLCTGGHHKNVISTFCFRDDIFPLKTNRRNYCGPGLSASGRFI
jgi:hypothetical protein